MEHIIYVDIFKYVMLYNFDKKKKPRNGSVAPDQGRFIQIVKIYNAIGNYIYSPAHWDGGYTMLKQFTIFRKFNILYHLHI